MPVAPQRPKHIVHLLYRFARGQPFKLYPAMYRLLRRLKPDVFHSCNIAALEFAAMAALAGVPLRIHAEHRWDVADMFANQFQTIARGAYMEAMSLFVSGKVKTHINQ